jgi:hypothetical protein
VDTPQDVRAAKRALRRSLGKDADRPVSRTPEGAPRLAFLLAAAVERDIEIR